MNTSRILSIFKPRIFSRMMSKKCEEIKIPMPWGNVAGKWWGPLDKRPILSIHGWQDNCGTFDLLIPKLPDHLSFLAIDLPGHGLSDKIPPGMFYFGVNSSVLVRRIQKIFKWDKVSLMGHSLGGITSYMFGFLYPDDVDFLITFDALGPLVHENTIDRATKSIEDFLKYDTINSKNEEPPMYTYEEIINRFYLGSRKSIDLDKCKYIADRNIKESVTNPGKFYFNRDLRLKCGQLVSWCHADVMESAKRIKFPLMLMRATKGPVINQAELFKGVLTIIKEHNDSCEVHFIDGTHHAHLNNPEIFTKIVTDFITKHDKGDRGKGGIIDSFRVNKL